MPSYTIAAAAVSDDELRKHYRTAKALAHLTTPTDLDLIFEAALRSRDRFPGIHLTGAASPQLYLERWVKGYCDAVSNPPGLRTANSKSTCTDPAIRIIVQSTLGMTDEEATTGENHHNLFMSAENIQGNLLEQYIALQVRPYGFLWCEGNVLRAIDFCSTDGSCFLQIKNKSNTENSSSSSIRTGTTIEKWFRLATSTRNGVKRPVYKWPALNALIDAHKTQGAHLPPCSMTERDYQDFLRQVAAANKNLITCL